MNRLITLSLDSQLTLRKSELTNSIFYQIRKFLTLDNPKWLEAEKHGHYTGHLERHLYAFYETEDELICSRGYLGSLIPFLRQNGFKYRIVDDRRTMPPIELAFQGSLRGYQERSVADALLKDFGVVVAPCGAGKTVIACAVIASRKQPTLIIVHTKELLNQWRERISTYLGIPLDEIGTIGAGKENIMPITVGMIQTLCKRDLMEIRKNFGFIIIDECHRVPSTTFTEVISAFDSKYMLGLSATPYRRDGLGKLIFLSTGNVSAEIKDSDLQDAGCRIKPEIVVRETNFDYDYQQDSDYQKMISELVEDLSRNELIVEDVINESQDSRNLSLILSDRKTHCDALAGLLRDQGVHVAVLTSDRSKKEREGIIRDVESGSLKVVCATGALAGEGLDMPRINRLFVTTPIKWRGRLIQYAGRALRTAEGKTDARVYDYLDSPGVLQASFRSRRQVYEGLN